ncbi:GspMb/PilO family protein [Pseudoalteromonas sp. SCSIO 43101]|uniref:GspMb/PilO family protein n=1 Tax=Pseudoalteromonas sp. SCSIO 43101 TaxID=2822847 RepID=UPI00202B0D4C|nr:GspMb/PilO family protein [Pseudoalteromonas sp. SCSIO 43101]URQ89965.1 hypothetical protein J8Z25_14570 [Pseudoalteromonas sp. SCSIO 43101]
MSQLQPKQQIALVLLAVLLVLKFAVVPLLDWQDEQIGVINNLQKRATKSQTVIDNQATIDSQQQQISKQLESINRLFVEPQKDTEFKLAMQQKVEQLMAKHNLQINNSNWLVSLKVANDSLMRHQLRLNISGKLINFQTVLVQLETNTPLMQVSDFNMRMKGQTAQELGQVDGTIQLSFYMQQGEPNE